MLCFRTKRFGMVFAVAAVALLLFLGGQQIVTLLEQVAVLQELAAEAMLSHPLIILLLIAYALLLAIPFVPSAEIGIFLLLLFGADIAWIVYGATVFGMSLAYVVGSVLPRESAQRLYATLGGHRITEVTRARNNAGSRWFSRFLRYRYVALAIAINIPGNIVLGGGGGIALTAGLSRLYRPSRFLATVSLAVAPVPVAVLIGF